MSFECKGCEETFDCWGELWVHRTNVHGSRLKIISRDIACVLCKHRGAEFFGNDFEMAAHLVDSHPNVAMIAELTCIVAFVMEEWDPEPHQEMKRCSVRIERMDVSQYDLPDGWLHLSSSSSSSSSTSSTATLPNTFFTPSHN